MNFTSRAKLRCSWKEIKKKKGKGTKICESYVCVGSWESIASRAYRPYCWAYLYDIPTFCLPIPRRFHGVPEEREGSAVVGRGGDAGRWRHTRAHVWSAAYRSIERTLRNRSVAFGQPGRQPRVTLLPRLWLIRRHSSSGTVLFGDCQTRLPIVTQVVWKLKLIVGCKKKKRKLKKCFGDRWETLKMPTGELWIERIIAGWPQVFEYGQTDGRMNGRTNERRNERSIERTIDRKRYGNRQLGRRFNLD